MIVKEALDGNIKGLRIFPLTFTSEDVLVQKPKVQREYSKGVTHK